MFELEDFDLDDEVNLFYLLYNLQYYIYIY